MHKMWTLMMMMTVMLVGMAHDTMGAQKKNEDHGQWLMTE